MSDIVSKLKEQANAAFRKGNYRPGINLYAKALDAASQSTPTETKRQILSNRAQTYRLWGEIYSALQDADLALSPEYTTADSPKAMTAKCYYRRSRLRYQHAMHDEALEDYKRFEELQTELGEPIDSVARELHAQIQKAMNEPEDSEARQVAELILACNYRGIQISEDDRPYFPTPQPDSEDELSTRFDYPSGRPNPRLSNPSATALSFPFKFGFVGLKDPVDPSMSFSGTIEIAEQGDPYEPDSDTIGVHVQNLLPSYAMYYGPKSFSPSVMAKYSKKNAELVLITAKGRLLLIPWETKTRDIWEGARWPRTTPCPFKDARKTPRVRPYEPDGAALVKGFMLFYVVPKTELDSYVNVMQTHLGGMEY